MAIEIFYYSKGLEVETFKFIHFWILPILSFLVTVY
jgi:hypothetical protein